MEAIIKACVVVFLFSGCTVVGAIIDSEFPPHNPKDKSLPMTEAGIAIDTKIAKSIIYDEPLSQPKKTNQGCDSLQGSKKIECQNKSEQLTNSINKHVKK